jgi:hypothetical protein
VAQHTESSNEEAARARRKAAAASAQRGNAKAPNPTQGGTRRKRLFNMNTTGRYAKGKYG